MKSKHTCLSMLLVAALAGCRGSDDAAPTVQKTAAAATTAHAITPPARNDNALAAQPVTDWEDLMTDDSRLARPPPVIGRPGVGGQTTPGGLIDDNGSGSIPGMAIDHNSPNRAAQFGSSAVVAEMDGRDLGLDGYVVPLETDDQGRVRELLFVSFYGACIHVPPPPPNQIIHVMLSRPIAVPELWAPFHLRGTLHIARFNADIASASYEAAGAAITPVAG